MFIPGSVPKRIGIIGVALLGMISAANRAHAAQGFSAIDPKKHDEVITLDGRSLTIEQIVDVARFGARVELGAEALRRIGGAPLTDQQRFLLGECVHAYLPLDPEQQRQFEQLIGTEPYRGVHAMNTTWFEKGTQKGREEGRRAVLGDQVEEKFGRLSPEQQERLQQLPADRLIALTKAVLRAESLRELGLED